MNTWYVTEDGNDINNQNTLPGAINRAEEGDVIEIINYIRVGGIVDVNKSLTINGNSYEIQQVEFNLDNIDNLTIEKLDFVESTNLIGGNVNTLTLNDCGIGYDINYLIRTNSQVININNCNLDTGRIIILIIDSPNCTINISNTYFYNCTDQIISSFRVNTVFSGYITNCLFKTNTPINNLIDILCDTFEISNCVFEDNESNRLISIEVNNELTLNNNIFNNNNNSNNLIHVTNSGTVNITSCSIANNNNSAVFIEFEDDSNDNKVVNIENSTFANNENDSAQIHLNLLSNGTVTLTNNTITGNTSTNQAAGIYTENDNGTIILNNNLIANNTLNNIDNNISGVNGSYDVDNSHNNIISFDETFFTNNVNENMIGTTTEPLENLNLGELSSIENSIGNNDYQIYFVPLLEGSIAINAGDNNLGYQGEYDQRGPGYARIINNIIDIGSFEYQENIVVCFDGESLVLTRNIETGLVEKIKAKNVYKGIHEVYDTVNKRFIPVRHNAIIEGATRLMKFRKDSLGPNKPDCDFKCTSGHKLYINGQAIKARNVKGGKRIRVKRQNVYTIVTDIWTPININNLDVFSWAQDEWKQNTCKKGIIWRENIKKV